MFFGLKKMFWGSLVGQSVEQTLCVQKLCSLQQPQVRFHPPCLSFTLSLPFPANSSAVLSRIKANKGKPIDRFLLLLIK